MSTQIDEAIRQLTALKARLVEKQAEAVNLGYLVRAAEDGRVVELAFKAGRWTANYAAPGDKGAALPRCAYVSGRGDALRTAILPVLREMAAQAEADADALEAEALSLLAPKQVQP